MQIENNEMVSYPFGLKSCRNILAVLELLRFPLFVFFLRILADAQMNHANDLGPALLRCPEINI